MPQRCIQYQYSCADVTTVAVIRAALTPPFSLPFITRLNVHRTGHGPVTREVQLSGHTELNGGLFTAHPHWEGGYTS